MSANWKFETRSVHAGYQPDPTTKLIEAQAASIAAEVGVNEARAADLAASADKKRAETVEIMNEISLTERGLRIAG